LQTRPLPVAGKKRKGSHKKNAPLTIAEGEEEGKEVANMSAFAPERRKGKSQKRKKRRSYLRVYWEEEEKEKERREGKRGGVD